MRLMLCMLVLFNLSAHATFQRVWRAYKASQTYKIKKLERESITQKFAFENTLSNWSFNLSGSYNQDALRRLNPFTPEETTTSILSASLVKPTIKFGTFSLEHSQTTYDLSKWQASFKTGLDGDDQYEIKTKLSYAYDFFDNTVANQTKVIEKDYDEKITSARLEQEAEYLDVFTKFIEAKLALYQVRLSRENLKRADKRLKTIRKRVRNGTSRKVDLYLANSTYLGQRETIENAKQSLEEKVSLLEFILGLKIQEKHLRVVSWNKVPARFKKNARKNLDLTLLEKRLSLSEANLNKVKDESGYKLTLNLDYETNDIDNNRSDSLSGSFSEGTNKTAALVLTIPLGGDKNEALRKRLALEKQLLKERLNFKKGEIKIKLQALSKQYEFTRYALNAATKKTKSLKAAFRETNKLYARGQSNFDEVIRSEENYISAQLNEKTTLARLELIIANLAFLEGNIEKYLSQYQD